MGWGDRDRDGNYVYRSNGDHYTSMDRLESLGIRQNSLGQEERERNMELSQLSQTSSNNRIDNALDRAESISQQMIDDLYRQSEEQFSTMLRGGEVVPNNSFFDSAMLERMARESESAVRFEGERDRIVINNIDVSAGIGNTNRLYIKGEFLHRHSGFEKILKRDGHVVIDEEDWKRARELLNDSDILKIEDIYGGQV